MTQIYGTKDKRRSARSTSKLVLEGENSIECKLNGGKDFRYKLDKEVVI